MTVRSTVLRLGSVIAVGAASLPVVGTWFSAGPVQATNFGSTAFDGLGEISKANNRFHSYSFWSGGQTAWRNALRDAARDGYDPTRINTTQNGDNQAADVHVTIGNLNSGYYGYVRCPSDGTTKWHRSQ